MTLIGTWLKKKERDEGGAVDIGIVFAGSQTGFALWCHFR